MSYSDINDQKNEVPEETIIQLVTDENEGSLSNEVILARFNQIRDDWEEEMNAMISIGGYATPITTPAAALALLRGWSKGGVSYKLYKRKDMVPEARQKEYDRINKLLDEVRRGAFKLPGTEQTSTSAETGFGMAVITNNRFSVT